MKKLFNSVRLKVEKFALLVTLIGLTSCTTIGEQIADIVFIPHPDSAEVKGEQIELELFIDKAEKTDKAFAAGVGGAAIVAAALDRVEKSLEAESKRYIASYSANKSAILQLDAGDNGTQLYGFRFTRKIHVDEKKNPDGTIAMQYCALVINLSDQFMALKTYDHYLRYSKAKVVAFDLLSPFGIDLLNPWEIITDWFFEGEDPFKLPRDNDLDLAIAVNVNNLVFDAKKGTAVETEIGSREFKLKEQKLQGKPEKGEKKNDCESLTKKTAKTKSNEASKKIKTKLETDGHDLSKLYIMSKPQPAKKNGEKAFISIKVAVTEVDDFGTRVKELSDTFKSERPGVEGKLNDIFSGGR